MEIIRLSIIGHVNRNIYICKMKKITYVLSLLLFVVIQINANAQSPVKTVSDDEEISVPDSLQSERLDSLNSHPSEAWYGKSWDTLYVRLSRHAKPGVNDTVLLPLLTSDLEKFVMPVPGEVLSEFGWRSGRVHAGIDLRLEKGDSVYCAFDGVVRMSRYFSGYGNIVVVRHYNGLETVYSHLSKRLTKVNQKVKAGQVLGLGGRTGRATCNHLHFEVRYLEEPMNPRLVVDFNDKKMVTDTLLVTNDSFFHRYKSNKKSNSPSQEFKIEKGTDYYVIRQGDTLYSIARRSGTTVAALCEKNNIESNSILRIGQKLKL